MGRNSGSTPKRNQAYTVGVNSVWLASIQKAFYRSMEMQRLYFEMLKELPPERVDYYEISRRGIDTRIALIYDGNTLDKSHNVTIETTEMKFPKNSSPP